MRNRTSRIGVLLGSLLVLAALAPADQDNASSPETLARLRSEIASKFYQNAIEMLPSPQGPDETAIERVALWSRRWMEAERDSAGGRPGRITSIEAHRDRMRKWETEFGALVEGESSGISRNASDRFKFHRLEAEFWLAKARAE